MSYLLQDLLEDVISESGQFIIGLDSTLISATRFERMVVRSLATYSRYLPIEEKQTGLLFDGRTWTIDGDGFIPSTLTSISLPLGDSFTPQFTGLWGVRNSPTLIWDYTSPTLRCSFASGLYRYTVTRQHSVVLNDSNLKSILSLDNSSYLLFDLVLANFLISLGRSRRAFSLNDLPITSDASELVSEGKELKDQTMENIKENGMFNAALII